MRGKVSATRLVEHAGGITPAYAGKRSQEGARITTKRDHPRLCGEKITVYIILLFVAGSPPPMRGKVIADIHSLRRRRITPAYAGKSVHYLTTSRSI